MRRFECKNRVHTICILRGISRWCALALLFTSIARASDMGGSLSGEVRDAGSAAIPNAAVTLTNPGTGITLTTVTNNAGSYYFASVPVGAYDLGIVAPGFRAYRRTSIVMNATSIVRADAILEVGQNQETITVEGAKLSADTASTQMGEVPGHSAVESLPLNGRSYSDLLALQAGVAPITTMTSSTFKDWIKACSRRQAT